MLNLTVIAIMKTWMGHGTVLDLICLWGPQIARNRD